MIQSAVSPWRVAGIASLVTLFAVARKKARLLVIFTAILIGATAMSMRQVSLERSAIAQHVGSTITFQAQVKTDPSKTASGNYSFTARLLQFSIDEQSYWLRVPVRILVKERIDLLPGQQVSGSASVIATKEARVAALLISNDAITQVTQPSGWALGLGAIRQGLRDNSGSGDAGALIPGMVLGDTSKQSPEFKEAMQRSGLAHLVAVSGANFAIVSTFVLWCMQFVIRRKKLRVLATAVALVCFIALVRPSPSVLRAAAMAAVLLSAQFGKRSSDSLPALGFAICAVVLGDPWQSRDAGFALSVLATAGLLLLAPRIQERLPTHKKFAGALAPPIAAMVFCSPILVSLSGYLSPMSIVANFLAAPAVAPITVLGFIAALISPIAPWLAEVIIFLIRFPAGFITGVAHWIAAFPVLTIHNGSIGFSLVALILTVIILFRKNWKQTTAVLLILVISLGWLQRWPAGDWHIAQCDVGQGDSLVINLGHHRAIVIDVGPDSTAADKCLRDLKIKEISLLILSHFHADHVGGLSAVLHGRKVGQVWISNNLQPEIESRSALDALNASQIVTVQKGLVTQIGQVNLKVLWPEASVRSFEELPGEGSMINNSSIAVLLTTADWSLFSAGDLEPPAQRELVNLVSPVDIYKVSHHGSKYQDEALAKALSPQIGLISVGAKNPYGHPAPESIDSLTRLGTQVLRTDRDGAVAITASNHHLKVHRSKGRVKLFYWS
uniref:ComEC/Rec2 family competence protein n=1 Tax=Candidatus Planktophila sp. TaxID=2175601 RepID=UPI00404A8A74